MLKTKTSNECKESKRTLIDMDFGLIIIKGGGLQSDDCLGEELAHSVIRDS